MDASLLVKNEMKELAVSCGAHQVVDVALIQRNLFIGHRIVEEEL